MHAGRANSGDTVKPGEQPYFVVSEVMSGKREARLEFATRADLSAKADQITRQLADATLSVNASGDGTVILASTTVSTVALKPVTVPKVVQLSSFERSIRGGQSEEQLLWQPLQCQSTDSCWKQLGPFAEQIKTSLVRLSPEELDR